MVIGINVNIKMSIKEAERNVLFRLAKILRKVVIFSKYDDPVNKEANSFFI